MLKDENLMTMKENIKRVARSNAAEEICKRTIFRKETKD